jgi:hypothetical protein
VAVTQGRDETLSALAREVHYRFFDEPLFDAARAHAYAEAEAHLDALARGGGDEGGARRGAGRMPAIR